ncbi:hypothetical protein PPERSA_12486 [Pseudocohnilembus persalinus]|uniref:Uncharacterized protein n=1 Tax=Pseudocohnilembus persalinus TaxID=266149 RepID=A0A0V0QPK2_PSEPJ|nr:hypothetical protein PPERSA_12486 [Pseudocohnilembus persalinus]|eukprot:KRX04039.1 hypothetical protein PPERSA_12486 [Pseudocohnilembus persalinus]
MDITQTNVQNNCQFNNLSNERQSLIQKIENLVIPNCNIHQNTQKNLVCSQLSCQNYFSLVCIDCLEQQQEENFSDSENSNYNIQNNNSQYESDTDNQPVIRCGRLQQVSFNDYESSQSSKSYSDENANGNTATEKPHKINKIFNDTHVHEQNYKSFKKTLINLAKQFEKRKNDEHFQDKQRETEKKTRLLSKQFIILANQCNQIAEQIEFFLNDNNMERQNVEIEHTLNQIINSLQQINLKQSQKNFNQQENINNDFEQLLIDQMENLKHNVNQKINDQSHGKHGFKIQLKKYDKRCFMLGITETKNMDEKFYPLGNQPWACLFNGCKNLMSSEQNQDFSEIFQKYEFQSSSDSELEQYQESQGGRYNNKNQFQRKMVGDRFFPQIVKKKKNIAQNNNENFQISVLLDFEKNLFQIFDSQNKQIVYNLKSNLYDLKGKELVFFVCFYERLSKVKFELVDAF